MDADASPCRPECSSIHRLEFDVPWPPGHVAAYLLEGPEPTLVDAGTPVDAATTTIEDALGQAGYGLEDVAHVLVTHAHGDHIGQAETLREAGATVYAPGPALERLRRDPEQVRRDVRTTARRFGYDEDEIDERVENEIDSYRRNRRLLDPDATEPIEPGSTCLFGERTFDALETPGHEIHHLSYETTVDGQRVLFSGDALIESFRAQCYYVGIEPRAHEAIDDYYAAMDRLEGTAAVRAFPGHGPTVDSPARVVDLTRDRLDDLVAEVRETLAATEPATVVDLAVERVGRVEYTGPVLDTAGALGTLEGAGEVTVTLEDGAAYYRTA